MDPEPATAEREYLTEVMSIKFSPTQRKSLNDLAVDSKSVTVAEYVRRVLSEKAQEKGLPWPVTIRVF